MLLFSCKNENTATAQKDIKNKIEDIHTLCNADSINMKHLSLDLNVDMQAKKIEGTATWQIENPFGNKFLILDNKGLKIDSVWVDHQFVSFQFLNHPILGEGLKIPIEQNSKIVKIKYITGPQAKALQWLNASQTHSKKAPFLYTQSESIFARTWVPCPDGPGIRFTYDARIKVPKGMLALMSASGNPQQINDSSVYHFNMDIPIPAYLLALAVGDIEFQKISARTGVYAEPSMIKKVAYEFAHLEPMVQTAEKLYGPYRWGRYDVLVLPPGFPIGGMENPKLTFCTPTVIAGDRSLVNLIAHELAHSWSGNLVTSATWEDIWMNEGFTVYFERRISEAMNDASYADMLWELGYQDLELAVKDFGAKSPATHLKLELKAGEADNSLSDVAYEKGALLLKLIENTVGREKWDAFLNQYFQTHAFQSISTEQFLEYLDKNLLKGDSSLYKKINIPAWVYGPGIPNNAPRANMERFNKVNIALDQFLKTNQIDKTVTQLWSTQEYLHFLRKMPDTITLEQLKQLDQVFDFTNATNSEIAFQWFYIAIPKKYTPAYDALEQFLSITGRQKFIVPLYQRLIDSKQSDFAKSLYLKYKPNYHPIAQSKLDQIVK